MGDISWARDLPERVILSVPPTHKPTVRQERMVQMTRETFERIDDYTRSTPTGPSAGRIYRKNHGWPEDMDDNWFVFIVVDELPGTTPVCTRCNGRKRIRYVGREHAQDCDHCGGLGVAKPGQLHVPYVPVFIDHPLPLKQQWSRTYQRRRAQEVAAR